MFRPRAGLSASDESFVIHRIEGVMRRVIVPLDAAYRGYSRLLSTQRAYTSYEMAASFELWRMRNLDLILVIDYTFSSFPVITG